MLKLKMGGLLALTPGDRLLYDCPHMSQDSWKADQFFKSHRHKKATFKGYLHTYVGPLDYLGREPGRYLDPSGIIVVFDGEKEELALNIHHFVSLGSEEPDDNLDRWLKRQRSGDLPEPIAFLPLDVVCLADDLLRQERRIKSVSVDEKTGAVAYFLFGTEGDYREYERIKADHKKDRGHSWFTSGGPIPSEMDKRGMDSLILLRLGPLTLLAAQKSVEEIEAALENPSNALQFWTEYGRGKSVGEELRPKSLEEAVERIASGEAAFIEDHHGVLVNGGRQVIDLYLPNDRADAYSSYIGELSLVYWRAKLEAMKKPEVV